MAAGPGALPRRAILRGALLGVAAAAAAGCASPRPAGDPPRPSGSGPQSSGSQAAGQPGRAPTRTAAGGVLLAYFSRAGENYYYGGRRRLEIGNTEVLSRVISRLLGCDVHRIQAADPYPDDYDATVVCNVREQDADARPGIANPVPSINRYDTVLLASPIWNVRAPMIMTTFTEALDFTGKLVHPVTTCAVSGLGTTEHGYAASCRGATVREGLAVRGEEVGNARPAVESWLRRNRLIR